MDYLKIVMVKVSKDPVWALIKNETDTMEKFVEGSLCRIPTLVKGVVIVSDEEAKLKHSPLNFTTEAGVIPGNVFFAGIDGEELIDLTEAQAEKIMSLYFPKTHLPYKCFDIVPIDG